MLAVALVALTAGFPPTSLGSGSQYYVDSVAGSDQNSGTSPASPWRSLDKVNGRAFAPGDTIYLKVVDGDQKLVILRQEVIV